MRGFAIFGLCGGVLELILGYCVESVIWIIIGILTIVFMPIELVSLKRKREEQEAYAEKMRKKEEEAEKQCDDIVAKLLPLEKARLQSMDKEEKMMELSGELSRRVKSINSEFRREHNILAQSVELDVYASDYSSKFKGVCAVNSSEFFYGIEYKYMKETTNARTLVEAEKDVSSPIWYNSVPIEDFCYYRYNSSIQYTTDVKVTGGGVNAGGAVVGGVLFGAAGAIVGSRAGTEIRTNTSTVEHNDTTLEVLLKEKTGFHKYIFEKENAKKVYDALNRLIPEKDYAYVQMLANQR